jgi:hypothetical protein
MTTPQIVFTKATRAAKKLRVGLSGPSGSGKTEQCLAMAAYIVSKEGGKIAVIDTENGEATLYSDLYDFDHVNIEPPYTADKYIAAFEAAVEQGYTVVIVDSGSHLWEGDGGILQRKEELDAVPGSNHFTNWGKMTPEWNRFRSMILHNKVHLFMTFRAKQAYAVENAEGKKTKPTKLGVQPILREGLDYEFSVFFELQMSHKATVSKMRGASPLSDEKQWDLRDTKKGSAIDVLYQWMKSGAETTVQSVVPDQPSARAGVRPVAPHPAEREMPKDVREWVLTIGKQPPAGNKGRKLGDIESGDLTRILDWFSSKEGWEDWAKAVDTVLTDRALAADSAGARLFPGPVPQTQSEAGLEDEPGSVDEFELVPEALKDAKDDLPF